MSDAAITMLEQPIDTRIQSRGERRMATTTTAKTAAVPPFVILRRHGETDRDHRTACSRADQAYIAVDQGTAWIDASLVIDVRPARSIYAWSPSFIARLLDAAAPYQSPSHRAFSVSHESATISMWTATEAEEFAAIAAEMIAADVKENRFDREER
jgi:hypothetical protein